MSWKSDLCPVGRAQGPTQHCCIPRWSNEVFEANLLVFLLQELM